MAKSKKSLRKSLINPDKTYVDSRAYGGHYRAERGSKSRATVNDAFKEASAHLLSANIPSRLIRAALDPFRQDFNKGLLHQRLVSLFHKQSAAMGGFAFAALKDFEINPEFTFDRLLLVNTDVYVDHENSCLSIHLRSRSGPDFKQLKTLKQYTLTVIAIYPNIRQASIETSDEAIENLPVGEPLDCRVLLDIPPDADEYLVCLKITGAFGDGDSNNMKAKGMRIVAVGKVE